MPTSSAASIHWAVAGPVVLAVLLVAGIGLALLAWLWRDANRHGQPGWVWVLLTLMFGFPILVWLILRSTTIVKSPGATSNG